MTSRPSTIRTSNERTIEDPLRSLDSPSATEKIVRFWREEAGANVLRTFEAFPSLAENRSLLLDLAVEEFKLQNEGIKVDARNYCERFRRFGTNIEESIFRAIEVQEYLDHHPELLEFVVEFQWPKAGDVLQGFEVVEEIGRGALARVFLCRESGLGERTVVVKVARGDGYEADLLARLDHPNIVPIYSVINDKDLYATYICMPYRGRGTLQDLVKRIAGEVPISGAVVLEVARYLDPASGSKHRKEGQREVAYVDTVVRLAVKLSDALAHAHRVGVLHGDLKPSNVLLTPTGEPLLIDFNLAKDERSDAAPRGGTLAYMPPELLRGVAQALDADDGTYDVKSEVYSFGILLFQLLAGRLPFEVRGDSVSPCVGAQQILEELNTMSPAIGQLNRSVNKSLEQLVRDCIALNPSDRPQSMAEVQRRLQRQNTWIPRTGRLVRSRPLSAMAAAVVAAVVMLALVVYFASRPPYVVRQFNQGMALQQQGQYSDAAICFTAAMADEKQRPEAIYQRGMTYLLCNEPSMALSDFSRSSLNYHDARSAALAGYCFNLKKEHLPAIKWYERALSEGFETAALQNNLGISYAICQSDVGHIERFDLAVDHLNRALSLDGQLISALYNLVVVARIRTDGIPIASAKSTAEAIEHLVRLRPDDRQLLHVASRTYGQLANIDKHYVDRCVEVVQAALECDAGPTLDELTNSAHFSSLRQHSSFEFLCSLALNSSPKSLSRGISTFVNPGSQRVEVPANGI